MPGKRKARSLRARSGAAVTKKEMKRFRAAASVLGGFEGVQAGASIGKLHKGKVAKMLGATFGGGGLAGAHKRAMEAAKKRNKALKRRK